MVNQGSLTFWVDEQAIKGVVNLSLRALEGFTNSFFQLMNAPLTSPGYSGISKLAKTVEIKYHVQSHGYLAHVVIDSTGLKVYGEWISRKHGKEKWRT